MADTPLGGIIEFFGRIGVLILSWKDEGNIVKVDDRYFKKLERENEPDRKYFCAKFFKIALVCKQFVTASYLEPLCVIIIPVQIK